MTSLSLTSSSSSSSSSSISSSLTSASSSSSSSSASASISSSSTTRNRRNRNHDGQPPSLASHLHSLDIDQFSEIHERKVIRDFCRAYVRLEAQIDEWRRQESQVVVNRQTAAMREDLLFTWLLTQSDDPETAAFRLPDAMHPLSNSAHQLTTGGQSSSSSDRSREAAITLAPRSRKSAKSQLGGGYYLRLGPQRKPRISEEVLEQALDWREFVQLLGSGKVDFSRPEKLILEQVDQFRQRNSLLGRPKITSRLPKGLHPNLSKNYKETPELHDPDILRLIQNLLDQTRARTLQVQRRKAAESQLRALCSEGAHIPIIREFFRRTMATAQGSTSVPLPVDLVPGGRRLKRVEMRRSKFGLRDLENTIRDACDSYFDRRLAQRFDQGEGELSPAVRMQGLCAAIATRRSHFEALRDELLFAIDTVRQQKIQVTERWCLSRVDDPSRPPAAVEIDRPPAHRDDDADDEMDDDEELDTMLMDPDESYSD